MSDMPARDKDRLLASLLDDWEHGSALRAAQSAARSIRRRRVVRRVSLSAGTVTLLAAIVTVLTTSREHGAAQTNQPDIETRASAPALEIISDDELLALLRDQPVFAVRDARGIASVVWLDDQDSNRNTN